MLAVVCKKSANLGARITRTCAPRHGCVLRAYSEGARGQHPEECLGHLPCLPQGFVAKPKVADDGTQDILNWEVVIPGKEGTIWQGARIPMTMQFSEDYPNKPPVCKFKLIPGTNKPLFHPNVYPSGKICLSLLDENKVAAKTNSLTGLLLAFHLPPTCLPLASNLRRHAPHAPAHVACLLCAGMEAVAHHQASTHWNPDSSRRS